MLPKIRTRDIVGSDRAGTGDDAAAGGIKKKTGLHFCRLFLFLFLFLVAFLVDDCDLSEGLLCWFRLFVFIVLCLVLYVFMFFFPI